MRAGWAAPTRAMSGAVIIGNATGTRPAGRAGRSPRHIEPGSRRPSIARRWPVFHRKSHIFVRCGADTLAVIDTDDDFANCTSPTSTSFRSVMPPPHISISSRYHSSSARRCRRRLIASRDATCRPPAPPSTTAIAAAHEAAGVGPREVASAVRTALFAGTAGPYL